jgi:hypothetical protein
MVHGYASSTSRCRSPCMGSEIACVYGYASLASRCRSSCTDSGIVCVYGCLHWHRGVAEARAFNAEAGAVVAEDGSAVAEAGIARLAVTSLRNSGSGLRNNGLASVVSRQAHQQIPAKKIPQKTGPLPWLTCRSDGLLP